MNKKILQEKIINGQIIGLFIFIICLIITLLVIYNEKLNLENRKAFFDNDESLNITLIIRIIILIVSLYFIYNAYLRKKVSNSQLDNLQIIATILASLSALITLFCVILSTKFANNDNL